MLTPTRLVRLFVPQTFGSENTDGSALRVEIEPVTVLRVLSFCIATLACLGTAASIVLYHVLPSPDHRLAPLLRRFDLSGDPSLPAFYSGVTIMIAAGLAGVLAYDSRRKRAGETLAWGLMSLAFCGLAIDEVVTIHEMVNTVMHGWLQTSGIFRFAWVIPYGTAAIAFGVLYLPFLWRLPGRTRGLLIIAGSMFVFGAVGMEMVAGAIAESLGSDELMMRSFSHLAASTVEEVCEMSGMMVCIYALLVHIRYTKGSIEIALGGPAPRTNAIDSLPQELPVRL